MRLPCLSCPLRGLPSTCVAVLALLYSFFAPISLRAQGTASDYSRALTLASKTENTVFRSRVRPQWIPNQPHQFWYRIETGPNQHEFIWVDAQSATRKPAFDHARIAQSLASPTQTNITAKNLPIDRIEFDPQGNASAFLTQGKWWRLNTPANQWQPDAQRPSESTRAKISPIRPSRRTGDEMELHVQNRSRVDLELFWIDPSGERRPYGRIPQGADRKQHTFAGHVWIVTDPSGALRGVVEASPDTGPILIDESLPTASPAPNPSPRRTPPGSPSPDGKWSIQLRDHNLWIRPLPNGPETQLSFSGAPGDPFEESVHWSPDSQFLVARQTVPAQDHKVHLIESSPKDQRQPRLKTLDYLKPGDRIATPRIRLFHVADRREIPVPNSLFPNPWSLQNIRWAPDSSSFTVLYNQRGHQLLRLVSIDANTGAARTLVEDSAPTFIDYAHKSWMHPLDASHELLWMSERSGWNHLYLIDTASGRVKNPITQGPWVVRKVERVDPAQRTLWFYASGVYPDQDPYYLHFCSVKFDGADFKILTQGNGSHSIQFSPNHAWFLDTWSRVDQPPIIEVRETATGKRILELERATWDALLATGWRPPERFSAPGRDGATDIHGVLYRPSHFDPTKKYPVVEEVYAGPQAAYVPKEFGRQIRQHALAELGFIVVQADGMGTSHRSKTFHDVCARNLGDAGFPDRIAWIRAAAKKYPQLDLSRVGIYGGSAGGQNAVRALIAHSDFYKVAVADCGCHDNRMDKIWWNELWMGWPPGPHFDDASNVTQAHRLQGKLFLIVGELDDNVDPASTLQVVNALVAADKDFDLLVLPSTGHGAAETPYGSRRRMDFLVRHLWGREPRTPITP